jgi:uncharacterized membrane protein YvbJ
MTSTSNNVVNIRNIFASLIISVIVMFFGFMLNTGERTTNKFEKQIEQKVDKATYEKDISVMAKRLEQNEAKQHELDVEIKTLLQELREQNAEMRTDIKWLKAETKNNN